jgi:hypothetical protein
MALRNLSCANYSLWIAQRGGTKLVCKLDVAGISFNRALNGYSEANITVAMNAKCANALSSVNPWQHELLIFRDEQMVWCGPLIQIRYSPSTSRIHLYARDLWAWTHKRLIEIQGEDYDVEEVDAKDVFEWILNHAYNKQPWNMTWNLSPTGIPITRYYPGFTEPDRWGGQYLNCGQELEDISTYGVDFTVINRTLYGGSLVVNPPRDITLKIADQNWVKAPDIAVNGAEMSTRTAVAGGSGGYYGFYDDQMYIVESDSDTEFGLLETFITKPELDDEDTTVLPNAITQEAAGRHLLLSQPIALIQGGQLSGNSPFDFNDLIPGMPISVGLLNSIRNLDNNYRLVGLQVEVNETSETVNLELTLPGVSDVVGEM